MIKLLSIADIISLTNAILGFLSIIMIYLDMINLSFSLILLAILADGFDGVVARKTRTSNLGEYMESMADMISLCIAPAIFVYSNYYGDIIALNNIYHHIFLIAVIVVFLSFSIIRLASFHLIKEKALFIGLPASASAIIILIPTYFNIELVYILIIIIIISLAMISNIHFPKPNLKINTIASIFIILTIIIDKNFYGILPLFLLLLVVIYVVVGPLYLLKV